MELSKDINIKDKKRIKNRLNNLSGKEWIKFTKSWFIHRPTRRSDEELLHPAKFPESLVKEFIEFFTKEGEWVIDPFLGTGSTLVACKMAKRNGIGIELIEKYYEIAKKRVERLNNSIFECDIKEIVILGDARNLREIIFHNITPNTKINYCITSPPYWNQLKRNNMRQLKRSERGLDTKYSDIEGNRDLGNIDDYYEFIEEQSKIFDILYDVIEKGGYLTIITNNIFADGKLYPLAFDTAISLTKRGDKSWVLKDEKIWCQDDKRLLPLGIYNAWVGNRMHQYCLIFRKE